MTASATHIRVWDLPLRMFHWLLLAAVVAASVTGKLGGPWLAWHARSGALIMGLLIFRFVWGFIGPHHARFRSFAPTPQRLHDYLRGTWRGLGHNPLGALSVFALLAVLAVQVATGLFATDDSDFMAPLASQVDQTLSQQLSRCHAMAFNLLAVLMSLHVGAIVFHGWARKTNLVTPMLTGNKLGSAIAASEPASAWRAVFAVLLAYVLVAGTFKLSTTPSAEAAGQTAPAADW